MANLGRVAYSLGTAVNENTLALANINFDFSLFKHEAPKEFRELGARLTPERRRDAEDGKYHQTARRLSALFDGVVSSTPKLLSAYGMRVSSISGSQISNPRGTGRDGPFASHVGADGTAIWAAATSGRSALSMLLVACVLARLWSPAQATSLWVELVASRREEIRKSAEEMDGASLAALQAARQEISRSELAEWDASARAWQQTADQAHKLQQTQLNLVVNNLDVSIGNTLNTYRSLIDNLNIALETTEELMNGKPQTARHGAFLLGLQSWHIYPDMVVHGKEIREIRQNDPLVPQGSILTLGLQYDVLDSRGVYWSLPLAHLRYYGEPVQSTRSTSHDSSRVSPDMLTYVVLGALARRWVKEPSEMLAVIEWFADLQECLEVIATTSASSSNSSGTNCSHEIEENNKLEAQNLLHRSGWMSSLMATARSQRDLEGVDQEQATQLLQLEFRKFGRSFLDDKPEKDDEIAFGLCQPHLTMSVVTSIQSRIDMLRRHVQELYNSDCTYVIRYRHSPLRKRAGYPLRARKHGGILDRLESEYAEKSYIEYTTVFPIKRENVLKRTRNGRQIPSLRHRRWITKRWDKDQLFRRQGLSTCVCDGDCSLRDCLCATSILGCSENCPCRLLRRKCDVTVHITKFRDIEEARKHEIESLTGDECISGGIEAIFDYARTISTSETQSQVFGEKLATKTWQSGRPNGRVYLPNAPWSDVLPGPVLMDWMFGDENTAAVYKVREDEEPTNAFNWPTSFKLDDFKPVFDSRSFNITELARHLRGLGTLDSPAYIVSLRAIAAITDIYKLLPETTIRLAIGQQALHLSPWVNSVKDVKHGGKRKDPWNLRMTLAATFASIAMCDSGLEIEPEKLDQVFAMSSGNSIFVAASLLCDPIEVPSTHEIKRVVGNVGRAGTVLLVPPRNPMIRPVPLDTWQMIKHARFDGRLEDNFTCTSLHLTFTGFTLPLNVRNYGAQDSEAYYLESLTKVFDRRGWVADLDVLQALRSTLLIRAPKLAPCKCKKMIPHMIAIDCWDELLEEHPERKIARARHNWAGRLAIVAVALQMKQPVLLVHEGTCWYCLEERRGIEMLNATQGSNQSLLVV